VKERKAGVCQIRFAGSANLRCQEHSKKQSLLANTHTSLINLTHKLRDRLDMVDFTLGGYEELR